MQSGLLYASEDYIQPIKRAHWLLHVPNHTPYLCYARCLHPLPSRVNRTFTLINMRFSFASILALTYFGLAAVATPVRLSSYRLKDENGPFANLPHDKTHLHKEGGRRES